MLDDLDRLDTLINHMLDAARLDQVPLDRRDCDVDWPRCLRELRPDRLPSIPRCLPTRIARSGADAWSVAGRSTSKWCSAI